MSPKTSAYQIIRQNFEDAVALLGYSEETARILHLPFREMQTNYPVRMDDGSRRVFTGYRVQHNGARGPFKGGIRFSPLVDLDEVRALAEAMSWKTAIVNLPYGGGKGGVTCDPRTLSPLELEAVSRGFASRMHAILGPHRDVPGPDMGTNAQVAAWMMDEYSRRYGYSPAVITGKPVEMGGSLGREAATGRGVMIVAKAAFETAGRSLQGVRFIVQGFGNVGSNAARLLEAEGAVLVGVADIDGAIYSENGFSVESVVSHLGATRSLQGYPEADLVPVDELLAKPCDLLVPAAIEGVLTGENAGSVQAEFIVEGANLPTTPEADAVFESRGVTVVPDILANAGGVTVSYFEWVQNLKQLFWKEEEVNERLAEKLLGAYRDVHELHLKHRVSLRKAAYMLGVSRVKRAEELRGGL